MLICENACFGSIDRGRPTGFFGVCDEPRAGHALPGMQWAVCQLSCAPSEAHWLSGPPLVVLLVLWPACLLSPTASVTWSTAADS